MRYEPYSGLSPDVFPGNWLLITALLCAGSALLLAIRTARLRRRDTKGRPSASRCVGLVAADGGRACRTCVPGW
ncbi:hypothetical protein [Streptomyces sp. Ncost-T10-10d]|uniref:hypothetical protein n=1 Tax=Streptomyces sp. Ncost-T10-10d TaxID=1839774 RepID=UPI00081E9E14|nr:hypothetical protein GA0115254_131551 [Streptomyces sp. Ncost-T10-10d]